MSFIPLPRMEVIKAVERRYPRRIPLELAKFRGEGLQILHGNSLSRFERFPEGVVMAVIDPIRSEENDLHPEGGMCIAAGNGILPIRHWKTSRLFKKRPSFTASSNVTEKRSPN